MREILFDTSFILTAVRNKLDLFEELQEYKIIIPEQVLVELRGLAKSKSEAILALKILEKNKFERPDLETKNTDQGIIKFAKENPKTIIATLDKEIKQSIDNQKLVVRAKKKLEIV